MLARRLLLTTLAMSALLAGCADPPPALPHGVSLIDAQRLGKLVKVDDPASGRTDTGTMRVAVPVRNISGARLVLEGRATFRGAAGSESASGWKRVFINKDSLETLEFTSLGERANDYQVELREGNR